MPQLVIDLTAQQAARLADAWEVTRGVRPTIPDIKLHLIRELKAIVSHGEYKKTVDEIPPTAPFEPT